MAKLEKVGFKKISPPSWSVDSKKIYYTSKNKTWSFNLSDLPIEFGDDYSNKSINPYPKISIKESKLYKRTLINVAKFTDKDIRYRTLVKILRPPAASYLDLARLVLKDPLWKDEEKLFILIEGLSYLSGFAYGTEIEKILSSIKWSNDSYIERMNLFYKYFISQYGAKKTYADQHEQATRFSPIVKIYRGFNIPNDMSIRERDTKNWFKQWGGKSCFYTATKKVAIDFATRHKAGYIKKLIKDGSLKAKDQKHLEGKIVVAEYKVPRDKIIYHSARLEEDECVCLPSDVILINYKFYGIDLLLSNLLGKKPILET
jgi:hypothetical protein